MRPKISLLVATMGAGDGWFLDTTIRSALGSAAEPASIEALVFSNAHNHQTDEILAGFRKDDLPARMVGFSLQNEGVAAAVNACALSAVGEYFFHSDDDCYFLSGWDKAILRRTKPMGWQYLTPRSIEPTGGNPCMYAPHDFGRGLENFREKDLLEFWKNLKKQDVVSRWGPPFVAAGLWKAVGGLDEGYFPGFGTDADFAISAGRKAFEAGQPCEYLGVGDVGIYHFQCVTTGSLRSFAATKAANQRFQEKWQMTPHEFAASIHDGQVLGDSEKASVPRRAS